MLDLIVMTASLLSLLFMSGNNQQMKISIPAEASAKYYLVHVNGGMPTVVQNKVKRECNCVETKVQLEKSKQHVIDVVSVDAKGQRHTMLTQMVNTDKDGKLMKVERAALPPPTAEAMPLAPPTNVHIVK